MGQFRSTPTPIRILGVNEGSPRCCNESPTRSLSSAERIEARFMCEQITAIDMTWLDTFQRLKRVFARCSLLRRMTNPSASDSFASSIHEAAIGSTSRKFFPLFLHFPFLIFS